MFKYNTWTPSHSKLKQWRVLCCLPPCPCSMKCAINYKEQINQRLCMLYMTWCKWSVSTKLYIYARGLAYITNVLQLIVFRKILLYLNTWSIPNSCMVSQESPLILWNLIIFLCSQYSITGADESSLHLHIRFFRMCCNVILLFMHRPTNRYLCFSW